MVWVALFVGGCAHSGAPAPDEIRVGHYASLSGSEATFGQSTDNGIRLAVDAMHEALRIRPRDGLLLDRLRAVMLRYAIPAARRLRGAAAP